jgi:DNA polymerase III delta prime subunit
MPDDVNRHAAPASNAHNLARGLAFLEALVAARAREESGDDGGALPQPTLVDDGSPLAVLARRRLSFDEYTVLMLALAPHLRPDLLQAAVHGALPSDSDFPQFGGRRDRDSRALMATGETAVFLLAGRDINARLAVQRLFGPDHWFARAGILSLEEAERGAPYLSGRILMAREWVERLTIGSAKAPPFSTAFPARRLETELAWADLVLEPGAQAQIGEICRWLRHRRALAERAMPPGRLRPGYRALFHGPPGTGKTLAAGLLGKVSGREVYRVDLSTVVSKYIGETEKNLAALFETAQHRDWVLFFDEADALFGKRTNVKDAHDRYANQEVSYLLQRVEDYDGLAVLATNLRSNIDEAFLGRFDAVVRFSMPTEDERRRIWLAAMPREPAPADPAAFAAAMARFELSGRAIVGALQFAALAALDAGSPVLRYADCALGVQRELEKEGRVYRDLLAAECAAERAARKFDLAAKFDDAGTHLSKPRCG